MQKNISDPDELRNVINSYFLPVLYALIDKQSDFIANFISLSSSYLQKFQNRKVISESPFEIIKSYHSESFFFINNFELKSDAADFDTDYKLFIDELNIIINKKDEIVEEIQANERFVKSVEDPLHIKLRKPFKKFLYKVTQFPVKFLNLFRKLFRKELLSERKWRHKIPLRRMTAYHLKDCLSLSLIQLYDEVQKTINLSSQELWKSDELINNYFFQSLNKENETNVPEPGGLQLQVDNLVELKNKISEKADALLQDEINKFDSAYDKAGTIEIPLRKYSPEIIEKKHTDLNENYKRNRKRWINTAFTLFEDWKLNKELYLLKINLLVEFYNLRADIFNRIDNNILPCINQIETFLNEVKESIRNFSGDSSELRSSLYKERNRIGSRLTHKILPETSVILLDQNLPAMVNKFELQHENNVDKLSEKRAVVKTKVYNRKIEDSEIDYISPKEIVSFETLSEFQNSVAKFKSKIMEHLENSQRGIFDIDQIADFNIESALSMFNSEKRTGEDPVDIAVAGLERSLDKTYDVKNKLSSIKELINTDLLKAVEVFNDNLIRLTETENVIQIKLNIAKAKAIKRTKELRDQAVANLKSFIPVLISGIKKSYRDAGNFYKKVSEKVGFAKQPVSISTEISEYLAATQSAVSKLPFVYQRLFQAEPLVDERFFEGREKELEKMNKAYSSWLNGNYASSIIVGEKGSGATTLINFYLKNLNTNYRIIRDSLSINIYEEEKFLGYLKNILDKNSIENFDDVITYLNEQPTRQIVIIENLQNLYLKKVKGFRCLKILFEIISKTNKNVFWLFTSSLYSWNFLKKVMIINDYFGYVVNIEDLKNGQMNDVILKRHRISGYNLEFEPPASDYTYKQYKKLNDFERQEYLKKNYFASLNKYAKSNISLALLFWLRSTREVTANKIKIGPIQELDYSFLKALSSDKIFMIHSLLIHDGLTEEEVSFIFNQPLKESRLILLLMLDDGIIIKKNDTYLVNPLLYRQIVSLLQAKNIIH